MSVQDFCFLVFFPPKPVERNEKKLLPIWTSVWSGGPTVSNLFHVTGNCVFQQQKAKRSKAYQQHQHALVLPWPVPSEARSGWAPPAVVSGSECRKCWETLATCRCTRRTTGPGHYRVELNGWTVYGQCDIIHIASDLHPQHMWCLHYNTLSQPV